MLDEIKPDDPEIEENNTIIGTLTPSAPELRPEGVRKILNRGKPKLFKKYLLESGTLIYDLMTADLDEVESAVRILKSEEFEEPKTLILLSSVFTWANTPTKQVPREPGDPETDVELEEGD